MFEVPAEAYDRFMGRYSSQLSGQLADFGGVRRGDRVVDVGCGPGALTGELVSRVGADLVSAVDPSAPFAEAARERFPGADVRVAPAEHLPFEDGAFDRALAQLVVQFMDDPVAGLREMARVTREGGIVAACIWDHGTGRGPLSTFWRAAHELDPDVPDERMRHGARDGHLVELLEEAGLAAAEQTTLEASVEYARFEEWWEPYTLGVGTAGGYLASLEGAARDELRARCRALLPSKPFTERAVAWAARGIVA
jgi:ubiquinone/menaquinone biosynthesis C-methylase UbiE